MKKFLEISKLLWITNIALLVILGYIVVGFIFKNNEDQSAIVEPISKTEDETIVLSKNAALTDNPDIIIERNIFGSSGSNSVKNIPEKEADATQVSILRAQLRLLATVAGDEEVACAVIENIKTKIQDLYRTGDVIEGTQIERIERNRIVLFNGKQREVLNLYVADGALDTVAESTEPVVVQKPNTAEVVKIISPTEREINKKAFLAKVGGMEAILKMAKMTPNIVNGKEEGLRITGLENSSMARYIGFKNGDVIQTLNGSLITNRRKALQVLRKARSRSSLDTQLLRGNEKKTLSFKIE